MKEQNNSLELIKQLWDENHNWIDKKLGYKHNSLLIECWDVISLIAKNEGWIKNE